MAHRLYPGVSTIPFPWQALNNGGKLTDELGTLSMEKITDKAIILGNFLEGKVEKKGHQLVVGILSSNRKECVISSIACIIFGMTEIPLTEDNKEQVIGSKTEIDVLICETYDIGRNFERSAKPQSPLQYVIIQQYSRNEDQSNYSSFEDIIHSRNEADIIPTTENLVNYKLSWYGENSPGGRLYRLPELSDLTKDVLRTLDTIQLGKSFGKKSVFLSCTMMTNLLDRIMQAIVLRDGGEVHLGSTDAAWIHKALKKIKPAVFTPSDKFLQISYGCFRPVYTDTSQNKGVDDSAELSGHWEWKNSSLNPQNWSLLKNDSFEWTPKLFLTSSQNLSPEIHDFVKNKYLATLHTVSLVKGGRSDPEGTKNQTKRKESLTVGNLRDDQASRVEKATKGVDNFCLQLPPLERNVTQLKCVSYELVTETGTKMLAQSFLQRVAALEDLKAAEKPVNQSLNAKKTDLIVTCLAVTRLTTDVEYATDRSGVKAGENAILLIFRHSHNPSKEFQGSSDILDKETKAPYSLILDVICRSSSEIYNIKHNDQAAQDLFKYLSN